MHTAFSKKTTRTRHPSAQLGSIIIALLLTSPSQAQSVSPEDEYSLHLTPAQSITPTSDFGDRISLRDGELSFRQIDIDLKGIGPPMRIIRTMRVIGRFQSNSSDSSGTTIGEWEIAIPRIKTITSNKTTGVTATSPIGWQVDASDRNSRCTSFTYPGNVVPASPKISPIETRNWWAGYQFVDDEGNESTILLSPSTSAEAAHIARTKSNWIFSCLPNTANSEPGEAFIAISPNGTKYWLDHLEYRSAPPLIGAGGGSLPRRYGNLLATRAEDIFGNWVKYQYTNGMLSSMLASDGRQITLSYGIDSASISTGSGASSRTWHYHLSGTALTSITQPDGSSWNYSIVELFRRGMLPQNQGNCAGNVSADGLTGSTHTGSITSPSGATATYNIRTLHVGRSYVGKDCPPGPDGSPQFADIPKDTWSYAIVSKSIAGPGIPPQNWIYNYSPGNSSWTSDCASGCPTTVWTDVTSPDGIRTRNTFSNQFGGMEGLLLREDIFDTAGINVARRTDYSYAIIPANEANSNLPFRRIGGDFNDRSNTYISERWTPLQRLTILQDGMEFTQNVNAFDSLSRPISITRSSKPAQ
ncbi:hypothetical protein ACIPR8_15260 [Stenotrophomonas sp. LARHCG68]